MISILVAMSENRVIGRDNRLPWRLPADLRRFKALTMGKPMIMGRRTWESLPGPLPGRRHIVITRDRGYAAEGCVLVHSVGEALAAAGEVPETMVIGGAEVYRQTLPLCRRLYLTLVHARVEGDTWFPRFDPDDWMELERGLHPADGRNPLPCTFLTLERRPSTDAA